MGVVLKAPGASFSNYLHRLGINDPIANQAVSLFGVGGALAYDKNDVVSAVNQGMTQQDYYTSFTTNDELNLGKTIDGAFTIIGVFRVPTTSAVSVLGTQRDASSQYWALLCNNTTFQLAYRVTAGTSSIATLTGYRGVNVWGFYAVRLMANGTINYWTANSSVLTKRTGPSIGTLPTPRTERIYAKSNVASWNNALDMAYCAFYNGEVSDADMQIQYDNIRAFLDPKLGSTL